MSIEEGYIYKGVKFWTNEIAKANLTEHLASFNDIMTENKNPGWPEAPALVDVVLDGKLCDIYHTDMDGQTKIEGASGHRLFIHFKDKPEASPNAVPFYGPNERKDDMHVEAGEEGKF